LNIKEHGNNHNIIFRKQYTNTRKVVTIPETIHNFGQ
jgi:hypothetical protein